MGRQRKSNNPILGPDSQAVSNMGSISQRYSTTLWICIHNRDIRLFESLFVGRSEVIKGIVSREFGTLFLISLDRFEGRNRAGASLFFILMTFRCLNLKKNMLTR
jgi:hypothetical protein